ncbi:MAG: peptidylprolyl isomerase [Tunicatimonas sp.]
MSLISKIRERTGLIVGAVSIGLILFLVGGDLLGPSSQLLGGPDKEVGEIAGEEISIDQYQQAVNEMEANYYLQTRRNPSEREKSGLRNQAWDKLIADVAFTKQFDELGIEVTEPEMVDMVQGNNIAPGILQSFSNPETGEFDRNQLVGYLQNMPQLPQEQQISWQMYEKNLGESRERLKYEGLLTEADFITTREAKQFYEAENTTASVKYLYVPTLAIPDSTVQVSDQELTAYIEKHPKEFEQEAGRSIQYVSFPVVPSEQDVAAFEEELNQLKQELTEANNDSIFASINTDGDPAQSFGRYRTDELPSYLTQEDSLNPGQVVGPVQEGEVYRLYKISDALEDTVAYARARHILLQTEEENKAEKRQEAQDVLRQLRDGGDFAALAREYSDDGSASRGGDLGWFPEGRMVAPFEEAVFSARETGLINRLIETEYGYHIIDVTDLPTRQLYKVATVERELYPSDATRDQAYRLADLFDSQVGNLKEFTQQAQADSLAVQNAEDLSPNAENVPGLGEARQVVRWAFKDASVGDVSEVYELDDAYVIAALTGKREKGTAQLENVREQVLAKVRGQKKAEQIAEQLSGLKGTLEERKEAYGGNANVYTADDLKLSSNTLPNVGFAAKAVGRAFALNEGEISEPVITENGVVMVELQSVTPAPEIADYATYKEQLQQQQQGRTSANITQAVREAADIEDERYKFY